MTPTKPGTHPATYSVEIDKGEDGSPDFRTEQSGLCFDEATRLADHLERSGRFLAVLVVPDRVPPIGHAADAAASRRNKVEETLTSLLLDAYAREAWLWKHIRMLEGREEVWVGLEALTYKVLAGNGEAWSLEYPGLPFREAARVANDLHRCRRYREVRVVCEQQEPTGGGVS